MTNENLKYDNVKTNEYTLPCQIGWVKLFPDSDIENVFME